MARVCARDPAAFEALYNAHSRLVYGVALRLLGDTATAEDVTQAVFLKIWNSPESFRGGNFTGWLVRVARNRALDVLRARTAHPEVDVPETLPETDALEDTVFAHVNAEVVGRALAQLPESDRRLIELGFFGGVTHVGLAERTGLPLGTVKTRIRSTLAKLRVLLEGVAAI
jgi:RNA polymerase sigma-70 factor, ECF subfamily